jgi:hypothetical protein
MIYPNKTCLKARVFNCRNENKNRRAAESKRQLKRRRSN